MRRRSKGGRPARTGQRTPSGRLSRAGKVNAVGPNERVVEKRETFASFKGGRSAESYDPIGRAWLVGLLDGQSILPERLRDAGRSYADDYWSYYGKTGVAMADLEPEARGSGARKALDSDFIPPDPAGEWLANADKLLMGAGRPIRDALHNVVIDHFFLPDDDPAWLRRLITGRRAAERARLVKEKRLPEQAPEVAGALPTRADSQKLANLILALRVLVTGRLAPEPEQFEAEEAPRPEPVPLPPIDPAFLNEEGRMLEAPDIADIIRERHAASFQQGEQASG